MSSLSFLLGNDIEIVRDEHIVLHNLYELHFKNRYSGIYAALIEVF